VADDRLTQQEIDDFGEEFLGVVQKAARQGTAFEMQQLRQQVGQLQQQAARKDRQSLNARLDAELPLWRECNQSDEFLNELAQKEPLTGYTYQQLLTHAYNTADFERVKRLFADSDAYQRIQAKHNMPIAQMPDGYLYRSNTATPRGKTYTRAEIGQFYDQLHRGGFKGRENEAKRIEADIIRAGAEGRVK
jgi:hypothetical protein